tara:strand:+ start:114 stop:1091 length:978 start_codon:yes stop_codon:yes gene_type:complete
VLFNLEPYILSNGQGLEVKVQALGAVISSICFKGQELTLGYDDLSSYLDDPFYLGATVGRYANRIANGEFFLNGQKYSLSKNQGQHCLHGGEKGFNRSVWQVLEHDQKAIKLYLQSPDGCQGFPGNIDFWTTISVCNDQVKISYEASTDKDTILNVTNHCYFNLNPDGSSVKNHDLMLYANHYLPVDKDGVPTGEVNSVNDSCFDFRTTKKISSALNDNSEQITIANGLDHCFAIKNYQPDKKETQLVAQLSSPKSKVKLSLYTSLPGVQVYTGNYLSDPFNINQGVCLEAQHWPDAPNRNHFPSATLQMGEVYKQDIIYAFSET